MSYALRLHTIAAAIGAAMVLAACGGGGGGNDAPVGQVPGGGTVTPEPTPTPTPTPTPPVDPAAPTLSNNIAADSRNWINYRRTQLGVPTMTENTQINNAALGHSEYQRINDVMSHDQVPGRQGFTGASLGDRLNAAGYTLGASNYAYGEVISGTNSRSGFYMAEELITAIYHRFVMFEPKFREVGTGSATSSRGYTYMTANFATRNGFGPGITRNSFVTWPFNGQTRVAPNFLSNTESPDPVPDRDEVGYPVSVHVNLDERLVVQTFTIRPRGGNNLEVLRVNPYGGGNSAASIIPLARLQGATTYDVSFTGTVNNEQVKRDWSFTTQ